MNSRNTGLQRPQRPSATPDENQRKISAIYGLAKIYGWEMDNDVLKLWLVALGRYSASEVEAGIALAIQTEEYGRMPVPAKIIRKIREACGIPAPVDPARAREMQAEAEWGQVLEQVRRVGSYGSPRFHATTERVIRAMGGWSSLCETMTGANRDFKHKDFVSMWLNWDQGGDAMELGAYGVQQALEEDAGRRPSVGARRPMEIPSGFLKRIQ